MIRALVLFAWLATLALSAPGHLNYDSLVQLLEGRTGVYAGANPPFMSALLGLFDGIIPGSALYLLFASALFYVPLMLLAGDDRGRDRANWISGALLIVALVTPLVLIDQGGIIKDVLFANLTLSAFTCLVLAERHRTRAARLALVAAAALLAALAAATRQNGVIVVVFGSLAIAVNLPSPTPLRRRFAGAAVFMLLAVGSFLATHAVIRATAAEPIGDGLAWGRKVLHQFDVVGMIVNGAPPFTYTAESAEESARITASFRRDYTPTRQDTMRNNPDRPAYFRKVGEVSANWWRMVRDNPAAWLKHRLDVFRWMVVPPDVRLCVPVALGIDGGDAQLDALGIKRDLRPQDAAMYALASHFFDTPLFLNAAWAALALALAALLWFRKGRSPGDVAIVAMLAAALAFAASFVLIGIACDVRYMFLLPVACCGALAHCARPSPPSAREASVASVGQ